MRFAKTSVALTAAALLSVTAPSALADDDPQYPKANPPATNCLPSFYNPPTGQKDKPAGHYYDDAPDKKTAFWFFAQSGSGTLPLGPELAAEFKRVGIKAEAICPVGLLKDGQGYWTPVGSQGYDNINLVNGRVWYPGGWKFTNTKTGRSHRIDGFWLGDFPVLTKASGNAYIDDKRVPHELVLSRYEGDAAREVLDILNPRLNEGKISFGPQAWKYPLTPEYVKELNDTLGTKIQPGWVGLTLTINAAFVPDQNMPLKPGYERDEPGN
ncbi:hypothetical protein H9Y04_20080 [Streptomyces sp. TRM66268-LWL]|uniref:Uncharacterized protein n=1 Tax=Streptomyces polyasparticus TaxID=2767826 RepID=A0ABR7SKJ7_9ACTN|nr:hypothetical protein [Streptomyces polyasparticus]MBC9714853.1 hypothetical protein [Streptomyces polyasparticus]